MKFLKRNPVTHSDKRLLKDYISKAEKMYSGNFVFGANKKRLEKEVREILKVEIHKSTNYWKENYGDNCNM